MMIKRTIVFICIFISGAALWAQKQELRTLLQEQFKVSPLWKTSFDGGYYRGYDGVEWTRWGIRNLTAYQLNDHISVDVGVMYNRTATSDQEVKNEFRPHQSIKISYPRLAHMSFSHRLRMEEQFYTYKKAEKSENASRFRYQIKTERNFCTPKKKGVNIAYWIASLEFFFNPVGKLQDDYILFNRGRHGLGVGYQLSAKTSVEGMVLYQHTHNNTSFKDYSDMAIINFSIKNSLFSGS
ncbi:DUF2490 domain-containing protein [Saccharicrinis fermentans]|nr:DUF2490 domain-containing protein [Saccharicrinis fermentans]